MPAYRLVIATMPDSTGLCDPKRKVMTIDVEHCESDYEVGALFFTRWPMGLLIFVAAVDMI